jgi:hypothetical protein
LLHFFGSGLKVESSYFSRYFLICYPQSD